MSIKLYVDDLRNAPEGWHLARTITEAIRKIATMPITEISLDHDIIFKRNKRTPSESETFEPVCRYIAIFNSYLEIHQEKDKRIKSIKVYCHSGNPLAVEKYSQILGYKVKLLPTNIINK